MATAFVSNPPCADLKHDVPDGRWDGLYRPYSPEDVERLRGSVRRLSQSRRAPRSARV
jgi:isocitrate lyase